MFPEKINLEIHTDERGCLIALEGLKNIPFEIKRTFCIFGVPEGKERADHISEENEVIVAIKGNCKAQLISDKNEESSFDLNNPATALLIPGGYYRRFFEFSEDCILLVLADTYYEN